MIQKSKLLVLACCFAAVIVETSFASHVDDGAAPGDKSAESGEGGKTAIGPNSALVIIDVQKCFTPGGTLAVAGADKVRIFAFVLVIFILVGLQLVYVIKSNNSRWGIIFHYTFCVNDVFMNVERHFF